MAISPVPRLPRKNTALFADNSQRIAKFGSLANGNGEFTKDIDQIQSLPAFLTGWFGAIIDDNASTIEDTDALFYTLFRQIAYFAQAGIAEFSPSMTYYAGSIVRYGGVTNGVTNIYTYQCFDDANGAGLTGISPDDASKWRKFANHRIHKTDRDLILRQNMDGDTVLVDTSRAAIKLTMPTPLSGWRCKIKDSGFKADVNPITLARTPGRKLEGLDRDFIADSVGGVWTVVCDGTDFFFI